MKRFLLWIISVALGVVVLLAAVMGVSYAFTTEGGCPDDAAQFGGQALEANGSCWQVPLLGGQLDKVFASPRHPERAEAGGAVHRPPGTFFAGVDLLHRPDHPECGGGCAVCGQRGGVPELSLPCER